MVIDVSPFQLVYGNDSTLTLPKRLQHGVHRLSIEAGLELGKQLGGDGENVHGQGVTLAAGIERHSVRLSTGLRLPPRLMSPAELAEREALYYEQQGQAK